ncbi:MAG TPA: biotin--[acetyl-CoA-carboxylase] ligase [Methanocorpusculum sp.]|nr:biotin--[acetyl-CoA-carboxylase] ligase [Methanocorpusculum sp.]
MADLSAETISSLLSENKFPSRIIVKTTTGSTSDDVRGLVDLEDWTVVLAKEQTAGRGRHGKNFYSPKNTGIYLSMIVPISSENISRATPASAVAVCRTIEQIAPKTNPKIKWVNDILINGKKVAGILCETIPRTERIIVGVGINLTTEEFPKDIENTAGSVFPDSKDNNTIASVLIRELKTALTNFNFLEEYRRKSAVIGKPIKYLENNQWYDADCIGIAENGGIIIRQKKEIKTLTSGEISIRI